MIIDSRLELADGQTVSTSEATTNVIDLGAKGDAVNELYLTVISDVVGNSTDDSETISFKLETEAANTFGGSQTVLFTSAAFTQAQCAAGSVLVKARIPRGLLRYVRGYWTHAGAPLTTNHTMTAFIGPDVQANDLSA
jgi:hypothetical protein